MASDALEDSSFDAMLAQIHRQQATGEWEIAARPVWRRAVDLLDRLTTAELAALFAPFPKPLIHGAHRPCGLWQASRKAHGFMQPDRGIYVAGKSAQPRHLDLSRTGAASLLARRIRPRTTLCRCGGGADETKRRARTGARLLSTMPIASLFGDTGRVAEGMGYARRGASISSPA
ncbi:MAG: hypothetical protein IPM07_14365 [Anaerolineales bacterium]|nr:hypothetical protein [Anaerolineales bacterium]